MDGFSRGQSEPLEPRELIHRHGRQLAVVAGQDEDVAVDLVVRVAAKVEPVPPPLAAEDTPMEVVPCDVGIDVAVSFPNDVGAVTDALAEEAVADEPVDAEALSKSVLAELLVAAELDDPAAASSVPTLK